MEPRYWRGALHEALGPNGLLMLDLIPELELVIGEQPPVPDLSPQDAQRRFQEYYGDSSVSLRVQSTRWSERCRIDDGHFGSR